MSYTCVVERTAAEAVFRLPTRERRSLQAVFERLARHPTQPPDFHEAGSDGRTLFTLFCGPFSVTYWIDHAAKEVRIALVLRD